MASVITLAFEIWKAQEAASGKAVLLNEFVFANVPNLDPTKPIDRNEKLPPANQIVHRQAVNKAGLASENAVAYSVTLGADVGDFDFNWIGLLNKESGTVAMITHAPIQKKLKTQNGQQGNVLIRSFLLEFNGAAEETQIKTSAETWQIDFTARLTGMDEMQRLINVDNYGAAAFFNDGFEVTRSGEQFTVKKGLGYVGGLRGQLEQNQILNGLRNTKIYADFSYQGNIVSKWNTVIKITSAATLSNYVDAAGFTHQVFAIASIDATGNVKDLRPMGALNSQEISALETRFKLDLSKKADKANITHQTGNSTELFTSQQMVTTELAKKQPIGQYANKEELKSGLANKLTIGQFGWGGRGDVYNTSTVELEEMIKSASTPSQILRSDGGASDLLYKYSATLLMGASATYAILSIDSKTGNVKAAAGVGSDAPAVNDLYGTANTTLDKNGFLRTKNLTALTTSDVSQTTGSSTTLVMSQNSVTKALENKADSSVFVAKTVSGNAAITPAAGAVDFVFNKDGSFSIWDRAKTVFQVSKAGKVEIGDVPYSNVSGIPLIGIGQKWQDVSSQRKKLTTYTNTSGKPIFVIIGGGDSRGDPVFAVCDGVKVGYLSRQSVGVAVTISFIVPPGSAYQLGDFNFTIWSELR